MAGPPVTPTQGKENSFKKPQIILIENPVGIDAPIQDIQAAIGAGCTWLDKVFGRAFLARKSGRGEVGATEKLYPHVWQGLTEGGARDLLEVLPNDNLNAQMFVKVEEPIQVTEYLTPGDASYLANIALIFWFNYQRIDNTIPYPFGELLKGQVMRALSNMTFSDPDSNISVTRIYETPEQIFAGYTMELKRLQECIYPWGGFRFDLVLHFRDTCGDEAYDL